MTHRGYRLVLAFFGACVVIGALLAVPSPDELGFVREVACEEWFESPEAMGAVRLTGCLLDAREGYLRATPRGVVAVVRVRPPERGDDEAHARGPTRSELGQVPSLFYESSDPALVDLAGRREATAEDEGRQRRFVERNADALVVPGDPSGTIGSDVRDLASLTTRPEHWMTHLGRAPAVRIGGVGLVLLGLLCLLFVRRLQRRWTAARPSLRGSDSKPVAF